jgi:hypothetical protein
MNSKPWYQSITIVAASVVAFLQTVPLLITQVDSIFPSLHLGVNPIVIQALSIIGIIVAIYGRLTATTTITK